ncbi:MAG: hypothetical protein ACR2P5_07850 [Gammaproteobacteria bacterium]
MKTILRGIFALLAISLNMSAAAFGNIANTNNALNNGDTDDYIVYIGFNSDSANDAVRETDDACDAGTNVNCVLQSDSFVIGAFIDDECIAVIPLVMRAIGSGILTYNYSFGRGNTQSAAIAEARRFIPSNYLAGEARPIARCSNAALPFDSVRIDIFGTSFPSLDPSNGGGGGSNAGVIIGGMAAVGLGVYLYNQNTPESEEAQTAFLPIGEYSDNGGIRSWKTGGRFNWQKGRMSAYWETIGQNSADNFSYGSGLEYTADLWTAAFSESVQGKIVDYDFSLSADYSGGLWKILPTYRLHSRYEKLSTEWESDTENSLNLEGILRYNRWTIRPSAGFRWENTDDFGDNSHFGFSAVRRF